MTDPAESPQNGMYIRAEGEQDRSPEFKEARDRLAKEVNEWLAGLAKKRDGGIALSDGTVIGREPRIVQTLLGRISVNVNAMGTDYYHGVSLQGEPGQSPLKLQAVRAAVEGRTDVIEATGSDPLARQMADGGFSSSHATEVVASFGMITSAADTDERYFKYEIRGDGSVRKQYLSETGFHTALGVRTGEDIAMAADAFALVRSEFEGAGA